MIDRCNVRNPIDRAWTRLIASSILRRLDSSTLKKWSSALESAILLYSDTQIITGFGILICGYSQLSSGLLVYHWSIITNLAWFSSLTHLATLTSLRGYFRRRVIMAIYRVVLMGLMMVLLIVAFASLTRLNIGQGYQTPARCLFRPNQAFINNTLSKFEIVVTIIACTVLTTAYITRIVRIFTPLSDIAQKWLHDKPLIVIERVRQLLEMKIETSKVYFSRKIWTTLAQVHLLIYVLLSAIYNIAESMLWEVSLPATYLSKPFH